MKKKLAILLFLVTALTACIKVYSSDAYTTFPARAAVVASPLICGNTLYCGTLDGTLYALDAANLTELWSVHLGRSIRSSAVANDSALFIEASDTLFALSLANGHTHWKVNLATQPNDSIDEWDYHHASPLLVSDTVFIGSSDGKLLGFSVKDGTEWFRYTLANPCAIRTTPAVYNNRIYFGDWLGKVYCVTTQGTLEWMMNIDASIYGYAWGPSSILGDMVLYQNKLYFGARNSHLLCLNASNGNVVWHYTDPIDGWISGTPLLINDTLYIGGSDTKSILAFKAQSGVKIWETATNQNCFGRLGYSKGFLAAVTGDAYAASDPGRMFILNAHTGAIRAQTTLGAGSFTSAVWKDSLLVAGNNNGMLYRFNLRNLLPEYHIDPPAPQSMNEAVAQPFRIYPDQLRETLQVELNQPENQAVFTLYSVCGAPLRQGRLHEGANSIDLSGLPANVYLIHVQNGACSHTEKFQR